MTFNTAGSWAKSQLVCLRWKTQCTSGQRAFYVCTLYAGHHRKNSIQSAIGLHHGCAADPYTALHWSQEQMLNTSVFPAWQQSTHYPVLGCKNQASAYIQNIIITFQQKRILLFST